MLSPRRSFSSLYIERDALDYPDTAAVRARFPRAAVVMIDRYTELMNRPRQEWRLQKKSQALILAVRRDNFIYPMPSIVQSVGSAAAFYNTPLINCLYDCAYCYLQGMYGSAHLTAFVNSAAFFEAAREKAAAHGDIYLSLSYDTDILGFEGVVPLTRRWIEFARATPGLTIEVRTKSARFAAIADLAPDPRVILAWTISPQPIVERFEALTASLEKRLEAARQAIVAGWQVRLCFDPVIWHPEWRSLYGKLIEQVRAALPLAELHDATVGVFRMNGDFFKALKRVRPDAAVNYGALSLDASGIATYKAEVESEMRDFMASRLSGVVRAVHC